ncbi:hypothetical protein QE152_g30646 [Popillia japonica]|uniref:protein-L-isoaspartate(D-aspartate) O-methyltransferase n=1 Tax=Popillia japonica TaxID=7064 RepID=A0AAW1JDK5_POPJA
MAWRSHGKSNIGLIRYLRSNGTIKSDAVENAMAQVNRANYSPRNPYMDAPQGIGYRVTISAPHMHAHASELLKEQLQPGERILHVESGSGNLTACMALMLDDKGLAVGINHMPESVKLSKKNIQKDHPDVTFKVKLILGDGRLGSAVQMDLRKQFI